MSSGPPTKLGKYDIIREIARSNDIVYEAYDPLMNRRVAIKELAVASTSTSQQREDRVKRFLREVKAAGSLAHPNIVTVYEVGEESGRHYMAMEFLDGNTLRNQIDSHGKIAQDRAIEIAVDVLCALDFAHKHGVIHRDIKPENIQILSNGTVKLTDFGIARLTFEPNLTIDGQVFGTPSYMSPEQVVGREIDVRSDIFSIGTVLFEMLTGEKPFKGDNVVAITYAIMNTSLDCPQGIGFAMWQVISKAMEKSPQMRFATAEEMIEALRQVQNAGQVQPHLPVSSGPMPPVFGGPGNGPVNPYAPPVVVPPPVSMPMPMHGQSPYNTTPYGGALPPDPYGMGYQTPYNQQPYPGTPYPQPGVPYNQQPYVPGGPYPQAPQTLGGMNYPHAPVYYPPAPRRPVFKPETKQFVARFLLVLLIVGTFMGLVIYAIIEIGKGINGMETTRRDNQVQQQIQTETQGEPVEQQIAAREKGMKDLQGTMGRAEESAKLADNYVQAAQSKEVAGKPAEAEAYYQKAAEADPIAPRYVNLAAFYQRMERKVTNTDDRLEFIRGAGESFQHAAQSAQTKEDREKFKRQSAQQFLKAGDLLKPFDSRMAREYYYQARDVAPPESEEFKLAQQAIDSLSA
ncbi:MAG: protein kinase [Armatimonadetes bacterium]|nr:protein kinase [Armatimonadota bacterium]